MLLGEARAKHGSLLVRGVARVRHEALRMPPLRLAPPATAPNRTREAERRPARGRAMCRSALPLAAFGPALWARVLCWTASSSGRALRAMRHDGSGTRQCCATLAVRSGALSHRVRRPARFEVFELRARVGDGFVVGHGGAASEHVRRGGRRRGVRSRRQVSASRVSLNRARSVEGRWSRPHPGGARRLRRGRNGRACSRCR